ncbi:OLC1v1012456C1 [Oldenlandia corymbosa var. corymbosa]|uniref:OLC1v1012456C1 n=1 Tax=Oldenlandia corymbosa var. corymbosa TaxID=529605 RepID=A0AAV1DZ73_OLDCO|nr:OLC1v1012456C1 [Oldenlandia corymbosa var. corymbosa]
MLSTPTPSASTNQTESPSSNLLSSAALRARLASLKTGAPRASMTPLVGASVTELSKKIISTPVGQVFTAQSDQIKKDLKVLMAESTTSLTAEILNEFLAEFNDLQKQYISQQNLEMKLQEIKDQIAAKNRELVPLSDQATEALNQVEEWYYKAENVKPLYDQAGAKLMDTHSALGESGSRSEIVQG